MYEEDEEDYEDDENQENEALQIGDERDRDLQGIIQNAEEEIN